GVAGRRHPHLRIRGHAREHRQDVEWVLLRQVPKQKLPLFQGEILQHPEQRPQKRQLDQDRQAAAQRVDLVLLVELHELPLVFLRLVLVLALQFLHLGLQLAHGGQRLALAQGQRVKHKADENREQDDGQAGALGQVGEENQQLQQDTLEKLDQAQAAPVSVNIQGTGSTPPGCQG